MISTNKAIIVEGKYDKIKLENIINAPIITTDGYSIFKNKEKLLLIKKIAEKNGIIILTDSDSAGQMIRNFLCKYISKEKIVHVYIPEIVGKEKRKNKPSAAGILGVEGVEEKIILNAFKKSGVFCNEVKSKQKQVSNLDLYNLKLTGCANSSLKRTKLLKKLELPTVMSTASMLTAINSLYSYDEFIKIATEEL